jgi:secretion/DNA translocation related TadE-like protein
MSRCAGSATVWLLGLALLPLSASALCSAEAFARIVRHRAEAAADLAALAAAGPEGCPAARLTANASEVALVRCTQHTDGSVVVTVRAAAGPFGTVDGTARAGTTAPAAT